MDGERMRRFLKLLHIPGWLFGLLCVVLILRIPSFFEPYSYGDEMIYLSLGEAIRRGIPLYSQIHDNKPPLLYVTAAIAGSLFWFKVILALWHLVTVFIFWKLAEKLFPKNRKLHIISTIIFALITTLPLLEGNIANAEIFMIGPTMLAFYVLLSKKLNFKNIFFSGILFSVATLYKVPAAFDMPAIIFLWVIALKKANISNIKKILQNSIYLAAGFFAPILLTFIWYFLRGAAFEYLVAAYLQNFGYLSSWRPDDVQKSFLEKNSPLLIRAFVVFVGHIILYVRRKKLSKEFIFISSWLLLSLFAVTLSERPYPHYLVQSVPAVSLLLGMFFALKNFEQVLVIVPLTLFVFVPYYFNFWRYPTVPYYRNFIKFATGGLDRDAYLATYGSHVPRNYKISNFIASSTQKNEKVFVWGDGSSIYALSRRLPPGRFVADYHIRDFSTPEETIEVLNSDMPSFIIVLPNTNPFTELNSLINNNYVLVETIDGAEIWKLLNSNVRALIAR
jgi:hypothetical protein